MEGIRESSTNPLRLDGYVPGLDVLRGLAVSAVVVFHAFANSGYVETVSGVGAFFVGLARLGQLGVYLFFTLSGFLITSILLKQRNRPNYYQNFYVRRALRILPAYLLMLLVLKTTGLVQWPFVAACLLFIANMAKLFHSSANEYGVFWTLAVEEQFYLIWPTVIRKLREPRILLATTLVGCIAAPLLRMVLGFYGISGYLMLPTNMDALLYGALCAVLVQTGIIHSGNIRQISRTLFGIGLAFLVPFLFIEYSSQEHGRLFRALWAAFDLYVPFCFFLAAILFSVQGAQSKSPKRRTLPWAFMVFLGHISYGLYLVHPLLFRAYGNLVSSSALAGFHTSFAMLVVRFLLVSVASILLATLSRRYFEQRFLVRKKQLAPYAGAVFENKSVA